MFSLTWVVEYCCCDKCNTVVIVLSTFDISCRFVQLKPSLELAVFVSEWSFWRDFTLQTWFMSRSLLGVRMSELHDLLVTLCIKLDKVTNLKLMLIIIDSNSSDLCWIMVVIKFWVTCILLHTGNKLVTGSFCGNCFLISKTVAETENLAMVTADCLQWWRGH